MEPVVLSAIIAGAVSLLTSTVVAAWSQRKKLESEYDVTLRTERLMVYRKLWQIMEPMGWYGGQEVTPKIAKKILGERDLWYFENGGGLFLSDVSADRFEELLRLLNKYGRI